MKNPLGAKIIAGPSLYRSRTREGCCHEYVSNFQINHASEFYRWKVHIGDIIAVSLEKKEGLSLRDLEDWDPKHLQRKSPHWKVGLVVALVQVIGNGTTPTHECHVEWLEKALDTEFVPDLKTFFRPWSRRASKCKLPHVLLRTFEYTTVSPANLLPVQITMLTDAEFKDGVIWSPDDRFSFQMHCPKWLTRSADGKRECKVDSSMDAWPELNHASLKNSKNVSIPKPLQLAWAKWEPVQDDDDLLQALIQGYRDSSGAKRVAYINRQEKEQKLRSGEVQQSQKQEENYKQQKSTTKRNTIDPTDDTNNKRVRISEPSKNSPATKPAKLTTKNNKAVKPCIKKTVKAKHASPKRTTKPKEPVVTTPSTKSTSTVSSPSISNVRLPKTQKSITIDALAETCIHRGKVQGKRCEFFERVQLRTQREALSREILVGQVVAVVKEETRACAYEPFDCSWGVAQILTLYKVTETDEWMMQVRWLLNYEEVSSTSIQEQLKRKKTFNPQQGLLETSHVGISPIQAILPVQICLATNPQTTLPTSLPTCTDHSTLPILHFQCRFSLGENDEVKAKNDWEGYDVSSSGIKGPLQRALECINLPHRVLEKYKDVIRQRVNDDETTTLAESTPSLQVQALSSKPMLERWGVKFHEGVRIEVDRATLHHSFAPATTQWTVKVGYIVPIAFELDDDDVPTPRQKASKKWYPFVCPWNPGQIVSIYEDENELWKMQVRWFHRYDELVEGQKEGLRKLDKAHVVFETDRYDIVDVRCCLPGRVVLSSSECESWDVSSSHLTRLPLIPRFCSHICLDEDIDDALDWTSYDLLLPSCPSPLTRGLFLDPRNRHNKDWIVILSRYYKKVISQRGGDPDEEMLRKWEGQNPKMSHIRNTAIDFHETKMEASMGTVWYTGHSSDGSHCEFSGSLQIKIPVDYIARPSKRKRTLVISLKVGDILAYYDESAGVRSDFLLMKHLKHPWFPFRVPWRFGQVLAIYEDTKNGTPTVELRRFYRESEIPMDLRPIMPLNDDPDCEDVFESSDVVRVPATRLLGLCAINLAQHQRATKAFENVASSTLVSCRCRYFFHVTHKRFQPLSCTGASPETLRNRLFLRGMAYSTLQKSLPGLQEATAAGSKPHDSLDVQSLLGSTQATRALGKVKAWEDTEQKFLTAAVLEPKWQYFVDSDILFHRNDRDHITWELKLGDLIAVKTNPPDSAESFSTFPFICQWTPCQLLAIFSNNSTTVEVLNFEVRYLQVKETSLKGIGLCEIDSTLPSETTTIAEKDILGPVVILNGEKAAALDWGNAPKRLPCPIVSIDKKSLPRLQESLQVSKCYTEECRSRILDMVVEDQALTNGEGIDDESSSKSSDTSVVGTCATPVFVDVSQLRIFYREFWIQPQLRMFETVLNQKLPVQSKWNLMIGDTVLVQWEGPKRYPFKCNWGVAEIVAIWKEFTSRDDLEKVANGGISTCPDGSWKVEIRWFYDRQDVVGVETTDEEVVCDEVFETDDVAVLEDVAAILSPTKLLSDTNDIVMKENEKISDYHVPVFLCHRFWSIHRKSLLPCGDLSGREKRARLYSRIIPKGYPPIEAMESLNWSNHVSQPCQGTKSDAEANWKEAVRKVIAALNLKEASKGAYNHGETLIGREKELSQLLSFFRAAIHGQAGPGGIRSSMFLAGAPGVGKTACIRSAVKRLESEQARGDLPAFNFIALNGMEMRHPFESYVKLWEAITNRKHAGSHEKACQLLEYYFTNPKALDGKDDRSVTIVLLDEIDYLVTEKQSVLYNFFDWPKRAASVPNGRRLVVIGISNTLNLAEQLMPSVQSRVGSERIVFKAYGVKEAKAILKAKISKASPNYSIFDEDAILFAAKKTAAMSGDIRKAFQICRGAAELLLPRCQEAGPDGLLTNPKVRISDVQKASRESFDSALVTAVSFSTPFQALLLVSLASLCRTTGREVGGFDMTDILTKMEALSGCSGDPQYAPPPTMGETIQLLNRLAESNLIKLRTASSSTISFRSCGGGSGGAWPITSLAVDEHTIVRGLKNTSHQTLAEKNLPSRF